jgi:hypothetical protein
MKTTKRETRGAGPDWTPRAYGTRGVFFCSPACGGDCRKSDHDFAYKKANALAKIMGTGWKVRVWENLGWHYAVESEFVKVHPTSDGAGYTVYCNATKQIVTSGADPRKAFREALAELDALIRLLQADRSRFVP